MDTDRRDQIIHGDCRDVLRTMPAESVQLCITSPPYWGLRSYDGVEPSVWPRMHYDGDQNGCLHIWGSELFARRKDKGEKRKQITAGASLKSTLATNPATARKTIALREGNHGATGGQVCQKCGAWLGCLGLEPTPELFVEHLVQIFREVRRVLRPDAVLFLNLGDSYATQKSGNTQGTSTSTLTNAHSEYSNRLNAMRFHKRVPPGLKAKDVCGIPWDVAKALRSDGWWLRSDVIWYKLNPMPESVLKGTNGYRSN